MLATINARRTLSLYVNKNDARNTPWTCAFDVQDAPYAKDRSGHAKTMAMQFTCIDWLSSTAEGAWLLAGTRGGDLVLFHANDGARLTYVTYLSCVASVRSVCWGPTSAAVRAGDSIMHVRVELSPPCMHALAVCHVGMACNVTGLAWHEGAWRWTTPGGCYAWNGEPNTQASRITESCDAMTHAAGYDWNHECLFTVLDDARMLNMDQRESPRKIARESLPGGHSPVWGYRRDACGLVAMLIDANECKPWQYHITHKLSYVLTMPNEEPVYVRDRPPVVAWRAWMLWLKHYGAAACAPLWHTLRSRAMHLQEHVVTLAQQRPKSVRVWSDLHKEAQAVSWWMTYAPDEALTQVGSDMAKATWISTWVSGVRRAVAYLESGPSDTGVSVQNGDIQDYVQRLAGALFCMAHDDAHATSHEKSCLAYYSQSLVGQDTYDAWERAGAPQLGEQCPACKEPIPFDLAPYARCAARHVFDRCIATFALIQGIGTLTCTCCKRQASATALQHISVYPYPSTSSCISCGNRWCSS